MAKPLSLQEALAQSTTSPRRATILADGVLYQVTLNANGTHAIAAHRLDDDSSEALETSAAHVPESGWVPGISHRIAEVSPAFWGLSPEVSIPN